MDSPDPERSSHLAVLGVSGETVVLDVRGLRFASEQSRVEAILGRRPGVTSVDAVLKAHW